MSVLERKRFNFFKLEAVENAKYRSVASSVTAHCGNASYKIFCTSKGVAHIILADWECISFQATSNPIVAAAITENSDVLVIIEQAPTDRILKCYKTQSLLGKKAVSPFYSTTLQNYCKVFSLKACSISESQAWVALGLNTGGVLLYKASQSRSATSSLKTLKACSNAVKGIEFVRKSGTDIRMFVCTDIGVYLYNLSGDHCADAKQVVDADVAPFSCCTLKASDAGAKDAYFVVAREEAIYCYTAEGRGPCFAIKGQKQHMKWFGKHIYITVKSGEPSDQQTAKSELVIMDVDNNMIVYHEEISQVYCIFPSLDYTNCYIFANDGNIYTLRDQEIGYKLQLLYDKNLYDVALKLVEDLNVHPSVVANVYNRYAEYLLQRGDVADAVKMFIKTIGYVSPFRVISKLLNIRYNEYIIQYLKVLQGTEFGSSECLLLHQNCCKRVDLPSTVNQIFKNTNTNYKIPLLDDPDVNGQLTDILTDGDEDSAPVGIDEVCSRYERWVVSHWPLAVDFLKEALTDERSHSKSKECALKVLMPLLFSNKDCVLQVINALYHGQKPSHSVNLVFAEILMQLWKSQSLDTTLVLDNFSKQALQMTEDVHIICHTHKFRPWVKSGCDPSAPRFDGMPWPLGTDACCFYGQEGDMASKAYSHQLLMQVLRKECSGSDHSSPIFQKVVSNIFQSNPHNMLTVIQSVATNAPFNISHLNNALTKEAIIKRIGVQTHNDISELDEKLAQIKALLRGYAKSPLEFRNSSCDACKQSLKQPAIFYCCQHAYHRECVISYAETKQCIICSRKEYASIMEDNRIPQSGDTATNSGNQASAFPQVSDRLFQSLRHALNKSPAKTKTNEGSLVGKIPPRSTNPFDIDDE